MKNNNIASTDAYGRSNNKFSFKAEIKEIIPGPQRRYERFFDGYTVVKVLMSNGRTKVVRKYTGNIYRQDISAGKGKLLRAALLFLLLASITVFVGSFFLLTGTNHCWYDVLAALIPGVFYGRLFLATGLYFFSTTDLKIREYRDGSKIIIKTPLYIVTFTLLALIVSIISIVIDSVEFSLLEIIRIIMLIGAASLTYLMRIIENRVKYEELPGETTTFTNQ